MKGVRIVLLLRLTSSDLPVLDPFWAVRTFAARQTPGVVTNGPNEMGQSHRCHKRSAQDPRIYAGAFRHSAATFELGAGL